MLIARLPARDFFSPRCFLPRRRLHSAATCARDYRGGWCPAIL